MNRKRKLILAIGILALMAMFAYVVFAKTQTSVIAETQEDDLSFTTPVSDILLEEEEIDELEKEVEEEKSSPGGVVEPEYQPIYSTPIYYSDTEYIEPTGGLTKAGGINYFNGSKETWYSSNVLYHYRTSEWTVGEDGVYRDADGYVVVARSDMAQGDTVETSLGTGKVYDSGCAAGTTDIYTAW